MYISLMQSLKVLSAMVAICLDDEKPNNIEKSLVSLKDGIRGSKDPLASLYTWEGVIN